MLCIILEERRKKWVKKILDAALPFCFRIVLDCYVQHSGRGSICCRAWEWGSTASGSGGRAGRNAIFRRCGSCNFRKFIYHRIRWKTGVEKKDVVLVTTSNDSESNLEEETDGSVETNTEVSESGQVEEVSGTSQAPAYNNRWNISLTDEEIDLLAKIVWLEANSEPVEGQEAVVEVVLNRMASDLYPDTLYDVLSQNNPVQFVSWKRRDKAHPTETEYQSIYNVLNGNTDLLRNDTMNFSTYPLTSNLDVKICCHYFCY